MDGTGSGSERSELRVLVEELGDIEQRASGSGGFASTKDAARRQQIELRLIRLVAADAPVDERRSFVRLPCNLPVQVRAGSNASPGVAADIGMGGVFIATLLTARSGAAVEVEIERKPGSMEHSLRLRGTVAWTADRSEGRAGLGVIFAAGDEPAERRVRRFVLELLRRRFEG